MGNIQERMSTAKSLEELSKTIKHLEQTRSDSEIQITDRLAHLLSDLNTNRIRKLGFVSAKDLDWSSYVFVCVQGFPALENEFSMLELPGQMVYFSSISFSHTNSQIDQQTKIKYVYESTFQKQAKRLKDLIDSIQQDKKLVFVYHSAGNFMLSMYFFHYGLGIAPRIKGMIDLAGAPLRFYISAQLFTPVILNTNFQQIMDNADLVHKLFLKNISKAGFDLGFKSKYETLSFLHYIQSPDYGDIFDATWNHPRVLKLIIHGRNDTLFDSRLLNQKAIYYAYRRELEDEYQNKLRQKYQRMYGSKPENLQERFIIAIPKGQHSIHNQPRNHQLIRQAVHQYLALIHD